MKVRRHIFKLLQFLIALLVGGAIINVAVTWGLYAIAGQVTRSDVGPPNVDDTEWWQATAPAGREVRDAPARVIHNKGPGWHIASMTELRRTKPSQPTGHICERKMFGWPMLSLQSTVWSYEYRSVDWRGIIFFLSKDWPIEPLWIGTVINTIFYAAVLWLLIVVSQAVRRRIGRLARL